MVRHDLVCPECQHVERDRTFTRAMIDAWKDGTIPLALCPACQSDLDRQIPMTILYASPTAYGKDVLSEFFTIDVHDGHTHYQRRVSSLSELRAIERESERHARNEPGCTPLVFRDFSQGHSNRATNALSRTEYDRASMKRPSTRTTQGRRIGGGAFRPEHD